MWEVYCHTWLPFGGLLTDMEAVGMAVDRQHLAAAQQQAEADQQQAQERFRWAAERGRECLQQACVSVAAAASAHRFSACLSRLPPNHNCSPAAQPFPCPALSLSLPPLEPPSCCCRRWATSKVPDAHYMNVGSGAQVQQLLFAGVDNKIKDKEPLPLQRVFKVGWVGGWEGGWARWPRTEQMSAFVCLRSMEWGLPGSLSCASSACTAASTDCCWASLPAAAVRCRCPTWRG